MRRRLVQLAEITYSKASYGATSAGILLSYVTVLLVLCSSSPDIRRRHAAKIMEATALPLAVCFMSRPNRWLPSSCHLHSRGQRSWIRVSPTIQKESVSMKPFVNWDGVNQKKQLPLIHMENIFKHPQTPKITSLKFLWCVRTHLTSGCVQFIKIKCRCSQIQFKDRVAWWGDAERSSWGSSSWPFSLLKGALPP